MNISFSLTTAQFRARTKFVTRRLGWKKLKVGQILEGCEKCQGIKKGGHVVKLGKIKVKSVRVEPLKSITDNLDYGFNELRLEGFPDWWPSMFVEMFCAHNHCTPDTEITRIEFEYL